MQGQNLNIAAYRPNLTGLTALVTGAGRGLGEACAIGLAASGARIIALSRTETELGALVERIESAGGQAEGEVCDVTDSAATRNLFAKIPHLDILVNNAGMNKPQALVDVDDDTLDAMLNLNVRAAFVVAQAAARLMLRQGSGSIIHMSSQMGRVGAENRTVYCATKHAIEGLTKAMAVELAPSKIRVNAVAPTFVETPLTRPFFVDPAFRQWVMDRIPMGELGELEDVVAAVLYLASPGARLVTGQSIAVDGGWTAR